jgi:hypothetical protein
VAPPARCGAHRGRERRPRAREHPHRALRAPRVGHRGDPPRRRRLLAPRRPLAAAPRDRAASGCPRRSSS